MHGSRAIANCLSREGLVIMCLINPSCKQIKGVV